MSPKVKEMLSGLRTERPAISGFVFTHASGKQIWTQQLSSEFKRACRIVGVPNSTFHHLRNSFLHDLSEAGATTREAGALAQKREKYGIVYRQMEQGKSEEYRNPQKLQKRYLKSLGKMTFSFSREGL